MGRPGGKSGVLEHKSSNISETRKDRGKVTMGAYRDVLTLFRTVPSRPPTASSCRRLGIRNPPPKTPIAVISGTGKATNFKFGRNIHRVYLNKTALNIWRKGSVGVSRDCPILGVPSIISGMVKAMNFKFGQYTFTECIRTKAHYIFWRKGSVGLCRDCPNFLGTPCYLRNW